MGQAHSNSTAGQGTPQLINTTAVLKFPGLVNGHDLVKPLLYFLGKIGRRASPRQTPLPDTMADLANHPALMVNI